MAISNIGRHLQDRIAKELTKMGVDLLDGICHDIQTYHFYVGRAEAFKWILWQIDEIEGDKE